jgi:uncharacterized protein YbjT (DUF2867 family)
MGCAWDVRGLGSIVLRSLKETQLTKRIIAVVGATGAQGGGLVRAILADKSRAFTPRAITRKPDSEKARELTKLGVEVVAADLDDIASITKAFAGAHGAFCVTSYWEHFSPEKELAQAKALAQAAKSAGVAHAIWSTLEDTRKRVPVEDPRMPTLKDKYKVPHWDAKGEADQYFVDAGVPTTMLKTSFYWDNLVNIGMGPKKGEDGKLVFVLPMADKKLPGMAVEDIGKCAYGVFKRDAELIGKTVGIAGEHLTGEQMATALSKVLGQPVAYKYVPPEIYRTYDILGADDLANMFQYNRDFEQEYCAARDVAFSRWLNPQLQTFAQWLSRNKSKIVAR